MAGQMILQRDAAAADDGEANGVHARSNGETSMRRADGKTILKRATATLSSWFGHYLLLLRLFVSRNMWGCRLARGQHRLSDKGGE
jgi:hypothetical protein